MPEAFATHRVQNDTMDKAAPFDIEQWLQLKKPALRVPISLSADGRWIAIMMQGHIREGVSLQASLPPEGTVLETASDEVAGSEIWIVERATGQIVRPFESFAGSYGHVWSPTGATLVVETQDAPIRYPRVALWSPENEALGINEALRVYENASCRCPTVIGLNAPSWTPDGKRIVFFHRATQVPPAPRLLHTVLDERGSLAPAFDAAAEMIALLDVETGLVRTFPGPDISRTWGFRLSPDGERVAFLAPASRLFKDKPANWVCLTVLDFNSGEFQTLGTEQPDGWELSLSWSPDSRHIAWRAVSGQEPEKLMIANIAASSLLDVPLPPNVDEGRLDFPASDLAGPPAPPLWSVDGLSFWIPGKDTLLHFALDGMPLADVPLSPGGGCDWLMNACPSFAPVSTQHVPETGEFYVVRPGRIEQVKLATQSAHVVLSESKIATDRWRGMERAFDPANSIVYTLHSTGASRWELLQTDLTDGTTSQFLLLSAGSGRIETGEIRVLTWKHDDGVDCSGALLLPFGWKEGDTPPVVMDVYGDLRTGGRYTPQNIDDASHIIHPRLLGLHGYAFFKPDMPQTDEEPAQSLVSSGEAAVAALRASGCVDADRIGVIGQSYGGDTAQRLLHD